MGKIPRLGVLPLSMSYSSLIISYVITKLYDESYFVLFQSTSHMDWAKQPLTGAKGILPHQKGRFAPDMGQNAHSVVKIKPIYCCSSTLNRFVFLSSS